MNIMCNKNIIVSLGVLLFCGLSTLYGQDINDFVIQANVLIKYTGNEENVIIPANLGITEIGERAFTESNFSSYSYNNTLKTVIIPEGVTIIRNSAFYWCGRLTSVAMPSSIIAIEDLAFYSCSSLASITLPKSVASIGNMAFAYCRSLASVNIPAGVTSIGEGAFASCRKLASITVDDNNTTFSGTDGILFNKEKTVLMQYPAGKTEQTYIMPETVTAISGEAFSSAKISSITISPNVTSIGRAAFSASDLVGITIPSGVTVIEESTFAGCTKLTSINIPEGVVSIGNWAFLYTSLMSITIPASVISIGGGVFLGFEEDRHGNNHPSILTSITVDERNTAYSSIDGVLFNKDKTTLIQYPAGKNEQLYIIPSGVINIGNDAFYGARSLTAIIIPATVAYIRERSFTSCYNLNRILISKNTRIDRYTFPEDVRIKRY